MVYRFLLLSDEVDNFKREIQIDSQATFLDLHNTIIRATGYDAGRLYSFFICDDDWSIQTEITLIAMDTSSEVDNNIMEDSVLEEFLTEERQKLLYVFDELSERSLFIELREIITGQKLSSPVCSKSVGDPPPQFIDFDAATTARATGIDLDDDLYGDDLYDDEELDDFGDFDENDFGDTSRENRY